MLLSAGTFEWWWPSRPVPLSAKLVGFPTSIGRWELRSAASLAEDLNALDFDEKLIRGYAAPDGSEVNLLLGYFATQVQGRELSAEWILSNAGFSPLGPVSSRRIGPDSLKEFSAQRGSQRVLVTYAYLLDGDVVADDIVAKLRTTWTVLTRLRSNGAIVVVAGRLAAGQGAEAARAGVRDFMDAALPRSTDYLARVE
jgi:EpsI family protein